MSISQIVGRAAKALARQGGGTSVAGLIVPLGDGRKGLQWAVDKATPEDVEMIAIALLERVREQAAHGALECDGCANRFERISAALAFLTGAPGETRPEHMH